MTLNETVALRAGSAMRMAPVDLECKHEARVQKSKLSETRLGGGRRSALSSSRATSKSDYFSKVGLPSSVSPHPPTSHDKQVNSHTRARVSIHLLFSGLAVGGDHGSFTFGVHAGFCFKTFAPLNTCQRKQPGKRSISIATPLVFFPPPLLLLLLLPLLLPSLSLLLPPLPPSPLSLFFTSPTLVTNQAQFLLGGLETVRCWIFFFLPSSAAVPQTCSSSLCCAHGGGSLKGNAHFLFTDLRNLRGGGEACRAKDPYITMYSCSCWEQHTELMHC